MGNPHNPWGKPQANANDFFPLEHRNRAHSHLTSVIKKNHYPHSWPPEAEKWRVKLAKPSLHFPFGGHGQFLCLPSRQEAVSRHSGKTSKLDNSHFMEQYENGPSQKDDYSKYNPSCKADSSESSFQQIFDRIVLQGRTNLRSSRKSDFYEQPTG